MSVAGKSTADNTPATSYQLAALLGLTILSIPASVGATWVHASASAN